MAKIKSVYTSIAGFEINEKYDMTSTHVFEIEEHSGGYYDAICDSFKFGYLQGMKAAKAEMKRRNKQKVRCKHGDQERSYKRKRSSEDSRYSTGSGKAEN